VDRPLISVADARSAGSRSGRIRARTEALSAILPAGRPLAVMSEPVTAQVCVPPREVARLVAG